MLTQSEVRVVEDLFILTGIPFIIADRAGRELAAFPPETGNIFLPEYFERQNQAWGSTGRSNAVVMLSVFDCMYCICTKLREDCFLHTLCTMSVHPPEDLPIHQITRPLMNRWARPEKQADFYRLTLSFPILNPLYLTKLAETARSFFGSSEPIQVFDYVMREDDIENYHLLSAHMAFPAPARPSADSTANDLHEGTHFESAICSAVEQGDVALLKRTYYRRAEGRIGCMSLNPLNQARYMFVCLIYAISRAAIRGGIPLETSFQLSDEYCQRMDRMNNASEIENLRYTAAMDYCHRVALTHGTSSHSPYTNLVRSYVSAHLYEPIKAEDISKAAHLNRRSLSAYFKNDMGLGIPDYINHCRLEEAKNLLLTTDMSQVEISNLLCFSNQSHFCKKFREEYGFTPNAFRKGQIR